MNSIETDQNNQNAKLDVQCDSFQHSAPTAIISQHPISSSCPALSGNSSPRSVSASPRFHSEPSSDGITALEDNAAFGGSEKSASTVTSPTVLKPSTGVVNVTSKLPSEQHPAGVPVIKKDMPPTSSSSTPTTLVPSDAMAMSDAKYYSRSVPEHSGLPLPTRQSSINIAVESLQTSAQSPPPPGMPDTPLTSLRPPAMAAPPPPPLPPPPSPRPSPVRSHVLPSPPPPPSSLPFPVNSHVPPPSPPSPPAHAGCGTPSPRCSPSRPPVPPPPPPLTSASSLVRPTAPPPPPPSPAPTSSHIGSSAPPLPPPPDTTLTPPPPPPCYSSKQASSLMGQSVPSPPAPPPPNAPSLSKDAYSHGGESQGASGKIIPPPVPPGSNAKPFGSMGHGPAPPSAPMLKGRQSGPVASRRSNLKPLHWVKVTRAMQGSLWAESQKPDETLKAPVFDMSELENLFSAALPSSDARRSDKSGSRPSGSKPEKIHLIDLRRANNCGIMLTKVKMPLADLMSAILALDDAVLDADQVDNLIKFTPTKDEIELLKGYKGDIQLLGECEKFFMELMKVPRVESKLRVFSFKIQFRSQVSDLKRNLNTVNTSAEEIRGSVKLKRIMQTILSLGNALNQGTARGSAVGFRLDSLLKLSDTRARNNKTTLMHYLSKVLSEKLPELLDFPKDLSSLELAAKIQLKSLAEEMQAINKGLEKVEQELTASENDGPVSEIFRQTLKDFLIGAEAEVRALTSLYANVGRNADALALYFGEDPVRCPFEQVVTTLQNFVRLFMRSHEENCKQLDLEKKKSQKEAEENCKQLDLEKKKAQKEAEENCKQLDPEKKKTQKEAEESCKQFDLQKKNAQMEAENKCKQLDLEKKKAQMEAEDKCKQLDLEKKKAQKDESENDRPSTRELENDKLSKKESTNEKAMINNSVKELDIPLQSSTQTARAK